jgi:hypothetical protein
MRQQVFQLAHLFDVVLHPRVQHLVGKSSAYADWRIMPTVA